MRCSVCGKPLNAVAYLVATGGDGESPAVCQECVKKAHKEIVKGMDG